MWKRLVAAAVAVVLAAVGAFLVFAYARSADQRALEGQRTEDVLVAVSPLQEGTPVDEIADAVELRKIPSAYVVSGAVKSLDEVAGQVLSGAMAPGEQLQRGRLSTPEALRAQGEVPLPEEALDRHQVTVALEKPRALGGNIASGDTVGVFMSFNIQGQEGYVLDGDGRVRREQTSSSDEGDQAGNVSISTTHLTLNKVPVVRVEGGYVAPPADADDEEGVQQAQDTINVTLALAAPEAERLVYAMEFGTVWLSLEPESADEDGTGVVVVTIPDEARDVYQ